MSYWGGGYPPYVSVAQRRAKAEKAIAKAQKAGNNFAPITAYRGAIAKTFWGKAWCDNLQHYSDYANRLPRGATYVRNGSVIDLQVKAGEVQARVMGSSLYTVEVAIQKVPAAQWQAICTDCASSIDTLVELLQGKLAKPVMERICAPKTGLFPAPQDIRFSCSCPDSAGMCKHIAAVLYGIGARLDEQPDLLFNLRQVKPQDLVAQAGSGLPTTGKRPTSSKVLVDAALADVFGLDMDELESAPVPKPKSKSAKPRSKAVPLKAGRLASAKPTKTPPKITTAKAVPKAEAKKKAPTKATPKVVPIVSKKAAVKKVAAKVPQTTVARKKTKSP